MVCHRPSWVSQARPVASAPVERRLRVLVLTTADAGGLADGLSRYHRYDDVRTVDLERDDLPQALAEAGPVDRVYHLGGVRGSRSDGPGPLDGSLRRGVLALFQVARQLPRAERPTQLTVVTDDAVAAFGGPVANPFAAGLHGLTRVLPKERADVRAVCVDFARQELADDAPDDWDGLAAAVAAETCDASGRTVLLRGGGRYTLALQPVELPAPERPPFRERGVYVIVGGSGGIGRELTALLAESYRARVVWISRGELTAEQRESADRAELLGGEVLHLRADCSDVDELRRAAAEAKARFGAVHGVIHAGMTFDPGPLATLDERDFRAALAVKADGSVAVDAVFGDEPLDFLAFFSSVGAFVGTAANGGYSCAAALQDAYALHLGHRRPYPVRVVNWGYWGGIGSGARPGLKEIFEGLGIGELSVAEGLDAVHRVLGNRLPQVISIDARDFALAALGARVAAPAQLVAGGGGPSLRDTADALRHLRTDGADKVDHVLAGHCRLAALCGPAVLGVFRRMGVLRAPGDRHDRATLADRLGIQPKYRRLAEALLNILRNAGYAEFEGGAVRLLPGAPPESAGAEGLSADQEAEFDRIGADHPELAATVTLTRLFLRSYPEILRGEIRATEIMFPGSSLTLVEGFYKANALTDSFNELVRDAVKAHLDRRIRESAPGERLRVVELGAGTGATTERVLPALAPHADRVTYSYTDISPRFLELAEERLAPRYGTPGFVEYKVLDLERSIEEQGFVPGGHDLVLATNVVHATGDLRASLRKAKGLLRPHGWLVLNELTEVWDHTTVVGGLLDGWWLFDDEQLRMPDSPLATPATWRRLLWEEGFGDVVVAGGTGPDGHTRGQHVIVGESDGLRPVPLRPSPSAGQDPAGGEIPAGPDAPELLGTLAAIVTRALKLDDELDPDRELAAYGFDSLTGMKIVSVIAEEFGVTVSLGDFYDHPTLRELARHYEEQDILGLRSAATPAATGGTSPAPAYATPPAAVVTPRPRRTLPPAPAPAVPLPPVDHPLSEGQRALWVIERTAPGTYAYNLPLAFRLDPDVDVAALHEALQHIVDRHDSLRSTIRATADGPVRTVASWQELPFQQRYLAVTDEEAVRQRIVEEVRRPFDLERGPLLRVTLFTTADGGQVLLLLFHHIVFDGVSIAAFLRELTAGYRSVRSGVDPQAPSPAATFAEFTDWQRELLAGAEGERLRAHWLRRLGTPAEPLALPYDRPRPDVPGHRGAAVEGRIDAQLARRIREFASERRISPFTVLLSGFFALLHRYTGQSDIRVGTPAAGPAARFEDTLGYFMNMVVLQADIDPDRGFEALAGQLHRTVLEALEHSHYPLLTLAEDLRRAGRTDTAELFRTAFYFQNWVEPGDQDPVRDVFPGVHQEGEFDLTLEVIEGEDTCGFTLKYDPDLFDEDTVRRLCAHYLRLLDAELAQPGHALGQLPLLTDDERRGLEERWRGARRDYPRERTLTDLIEEQAARTPDATAVSCADEALTYGELVARVERLAAHLRERGAAGGKAVGVLVDRSPGLLVALLAVLKSGACYVPLDPTYPADRLQYMAEDARLHLIVTTTAAQDALADIPVPRVHLDRIDLGEGAPSGGSHSAASPEGTAYVIYTSGSTGRPKGVAVPHRALVNFLTSMRHEPGFGPGDTLLALTTVCFDIAGLELYLPLVAGGRVDIAPEGTAKDGLRLRRYLEESGATVVQATPTTWKMLFAAGWAGDPALTVLCGGEAVDQDTADILATRTRAAWNLYGPTETTIWSAVGRLRAGEPVTLGEPVANTQLLVLDPHRRLLPAGVPGELYIGGDGLAEGYFGRPDLTAERFVPNPYDTSLSARLYRTGDLVRALPDGRLEYLGREDAQVKIRGHRVEPGEAEAALRRLPGVAEAVVVPARAAGGTGLMLRGFYTVPDGASAAPIDASPLSDWLPEYLVPDVLVPLASFPQTLNGKIDRGRLGTAPLEELRTHFGTAADTEDTEDAVGAAGAVPSASGGTADRLTEELVQLIAEVAEVAPDRVPGTVRWVNSA